MSRAATILTIYLSLAGCTKHDVDVVQGVVYIDNAPASSVALQFWDENAVEPSGVGVTDEQGAFAAVPASGQSWKAGSYLVCALDVRVSKEQQEALDTLKRGGTMEVAPELSSTPPRFAPTYCNKAATPLRYQLTPGKNEINILLTAPKEDLSKGSK